MTMGLFNDEDWMEADSTQSILDDQREPEWEWDPVARIEASVQESFGSLWGAASAMADTVGWDGASEWAANRSGEMFEKAANHDIERTSFTEIENPLDAGKWAAETLTSFAPDLVMMALGGVGIGTGAARLAGTAGIGATKVVLKKGFEKNVKDILKREGLEKAAVNSIERGVQERIAKEAAKKTAYQAGSLIGVSGVEGMQGAGQAWLEDRELRGDDANPWAALGTGAAQSAIAMFNPLNRVLAGRLPKGKWKMGSMTIGEGLEESGQEGIAMLHEAGINPDTTITDILSSEEGKTRLLESGAAGLLLGGTFGGVGHVLTKEQKKEQIIENPEVSLEAAGIPTKTPEVSLETEPIAPVRPGKDAPVGGLVAELRTEPQPVAPVKEGGALEGPKDAPGMTPLNKIKVKQEVMVEETGEVMELSMPADEAIKDADSKIEQWYKVRECLGI